MSFNADVPLIWIVGRSRDRNKRTLRTRRGAARTNWGEGATLTPTLELLDLHVSCAKSSYKLLLTERNEERDANRCCQNPRTVIAVGHPTPAKQPIRHNNYSHVTIKWRRLKIAASHSWLIVTVFWHPTPTNQPISDNNYSHVTVKWRRLNFTILINCNILLNKTGCTE